jgi:hypothetical protein
MLLNIFIATTAEETLLDNDNFLQCLLDNIKITTCIGED